MAKLVFGMNVSLDGFVDHTAFAPGPKLFRYFIDQCRGHADSLYGRKLYQIMSYWDDKHPEWDEAEREFAAAWRGNPKWIVSRSPPAIGPNATHLGADLETAVRDLKSNVGGVIEVGGPDLAMSLTALGLIDEYCLFIHPVVLGGGNPFFHGDPPALHLLASELLDEDIVKLTYVPA